MNNKVIIQSYKHDGSFHRLWSSLLLISEDQHKFVAINDRTQVFETSGRYWIAREPALYFLYKEKFFNVIAMLREDGIYYYCNLASPSIYDGEAIKNIDYDLDLKIFPDGNYLILDEAEFAVNKHKFKYPEVIEKKLKAEIEYLLYLYKSGLTPFNKVENLGLFERYLKKVN